MTLAKICGLSTPDTLAAALEAGADMVGFVFFPPSPRNLSLATARDLGRRVEHRAKIVALTVDADDATLDAIMGALAPDLLQLHGVETPARVDAVRARTGRPTIKAIGVSDPSDLLSVADYRGVADGILLDAKPPRDATLPGGNGQPFDWTVLRDFDIASPWMLSGGLHAGNVAQALRMTGAPAVDVSSGVETALGAKDPALIRAFIAAVRALPPARTKV